MVARSRYLVLPENRLAYESAVAVRDGRGADCVVVAGPVGAGKSSLVRAVFGGGEALSVRGRRGKAKRPTTVVQTAADWATATSESVREGNPADVAAAFLVPRVLVVEDVESIVGRQAQTNGDRLSDLLDARRERGLATVLTAAAEPGPGLGLPPRVTDRLQGGLVAALDPLSEESRIRLASHVAERRALRIASEQLASVADLLGQSPAEVEAAVEQLEKLTIRRRTDVDEALLTDFRRRNRPQTPSMSVIAREVAKEFSAKVSDIRSAGRTQAVVLPRQTAMFLARTMAGEPYQSIGRYFGGRNHSTVVHSVKRVERLLDDNAELASRVSSIRASLSS